MVTEPQRTFVRAMLRLGAFEQRRDFFEQVDIRARPGFGRLLERLLRIQVVDALWHAPACAANHFHKRRLVFRPCTCGAVRAAPSIGEKHGE